MTILYIDRPSLQTQIRIQNLEDRDSHTVEIAETLGDVHIMYKKDKYDLVLIDHAIENGLKCIEHINSIDPMQKTLTVSNAIACIYSRCDDCTQNHNARRLNNPTTMKNILRMVDGFELYECDHYDPATNGFDNNQNPKHR
ncbi:MAG: hypothetical protein U9Q62_05940 [Campylobacterota bacterium]|nr:hypothetical protein [Campylobacterota bacterium]